MATVDYSELPGLAGQELGMSDWLEITQARVDTFAEATDDFQWIHVDVERANRETGGTIAHGYLTLSLIPRLNKAAYQLCGVARSLNYGSDRVRFLSPVKVGARIRVRTKVVSAEPRAGGLQAKYESLVEIEGEAKAACVAEFITVHFPV